MSERLSQLLRQRALLQEHLAWLDREIAAAKETSAALNPFAAPMPPAPPVPPEPPSPIASASLPAASPIVATTITEIASGGEAGGEADAILEKYRVSSNNLQQDVRKGCLLYLGAAFVLTALAVTLLFFALRSQR